MSDLITIFKTEGYHLAGDQLFPPQPKPDKESAGPSCRKDRSPSFVGIVMEKKHQPNLVERKK